MTKRPVAKVTIRGLKCDAAGCDFTDPSGAPDESSLNRPCPKCGANLLTEADLAAVRLLQYVAHAMNAEMGPAPDDAKYALIPVKFDGTGKMEFEDPVDEGTWD